jgi:cystathionine gamma-synthase
MRLADLMSQPLWRESTLGHPLPPSPHAVSVALPCWEHVVGYEEKRPEIIRQLACGYPRFVIHPKIRELSRRICGSEFGLVFPSERSAHSAAAYVRQDGCCDATVVLSDGVYGVRVSESAYERLRSYWQHTGLIVSTRQAEALATPGVPAAGGSVHRDLRRMLAGFYGCGEDDVFLTPTGMAAQYLALQALRQRTPGCGTVQLGFPYVDTLKLQEKLGDGAELLHVLDRIDEDLERVLQAGPKAGCFAEIPGNPLLGSADLRRITPILRSHGTPLVADDVVATPYNVDLRGHADLVATSLTKYVVGTGEAMGGAVVCHPDSPYYGVLRAGVAARHEELLWAADAAVILEQARSFPERMHRHNENGLWIAERLRRHSQVERVWYPKWEFSEVYDAVRRPEGGWGALITFLPRNAASTSPRIYDRMEVCKGPSLGTVFTLACPFTLLAHYTELEWAEACGVSRYLIRLSVGLEDPEDLWGRLSRALDAAG